MTHGDDGTEPHAAEADDAPWQRVHPATPYVRGWLAIVVIAFAVLRQWGDGAFSPDGLRDVRGALPWAAGAVLLALAVVVALFWVQWRFTAYRVTGRHVQLRRGVIFRQQREARLDRVQAVDIARPLLPRLLGLSELRFEVADAGDSALKLEFLRAADAEELRARLLRLAAGARAASDGGHPAGAGHPASGTEGGRPTGGDHAASGTGEEAPEDAGGARSGRRLDAAAWARRTAEDFSGRDPHGTVAGGTSDERVIARVPLGRLLGSLALRAAPWLLIVALVAAGSVFVPPAAVLSTLLPLVFAVAASLWRGFNRGYGFRVGASSDGLRLHQGLTDASHRTIPPGRVQAFRVRRPLLFRPFGWVCIDANVAGYGKANDEEGRDRAMVLPVGTLADAAAILSVLVPDPGTEAPELLLRDGLDGAGRDEDSTGAGFVTSPDTARWLSPWAWRRQGYAVTETVLAIRTGRLGRSLVLVPHARTQGVRARQGWVARAAGVASVHVSTTAGPVPTTVPNVAAERAGELLREQVARAALGAREDNNHWLGAGPGRPTDPTEES